MNFPSHFTVTWQGGEEENFNQLTLPGTHSVCVAEGLRDRDMAREGERETGGHWHTQIEDRNGEGENGHGHTETSITLDKRPKLVPGAARIYIKESDTKLSLDIYDAWQRVLFITHTQRHLIGQAQTRRDLCGPQLLSFKPPTHQTEDNGVKYNNLYHTHTDQYVQTLPTLLLGSTRKLWFHSNPHITTMHTLYRTTNAQID